MLRILDYYAGDAVAVACCRILLFAAFIKKRKKNRRRKREREIRTKKGRGVRGEGRGERACTSYVAEVVIVTVVSSSCPGASRVHIFILSNFIFSSSFCSDIFYYFLFVLFFSGILDKMGLLFDSDLSDSVAPIKCKLVSSVQYLNESMKMQEK